MCSGGRNAQTHAGSCWQNANDSLFFVLNREQVIMAGHEYSETGLSSFSASMAAVIGSVSLK